MKIETHYNRIDRVVYTFDEADIERILRQYAKIAYKPNTHVNFEWWEDDGKLIATITVSWETPQEPQP